MFAVTNKKQNIQGNRHHKCELAETESDQQRFQTSQFSSPEYIFNKVKDLKYE